MNIAIEEAKVSLREGNHGFGAVILKENQVVSQAHDTEETEQDPTAHAEINTIRKASKHIGKNLEGCILLSTHEPCPMCAAAIIWANIKHIGYGYSTNSAIHQGRKRINLSCEQLFDKVQTGIKIETAILEDECSILYNREVRQEVKKLRNVTAEKLKQYNDQSAQTRIQWYKKQIPNRALQALDKVEQGYRVLLKKLNITEDQAPLVHTEQGKIIFHSKNFCPTLEACKILQLDTRIICKLYNEQATDTLLKQIDPKLRFTRNYERLRPAAEYCEELILYEP
jgi:tRNA(Arg) A34 adenosine deaminase TadA